MGKILINVDWLPDNFAAAPANGSIACVVTAHDFEDLKLELEDALRKHISWMQEDGDKIPAEFEGSWDLDFHLTTRAQLKYADNFITRKALARETGINEQQLSHYANGQRHPRPAMQRRITDGLRAISRRLTLIL